jgi:uncharacterized MAPEG superfamily protein
VIIPVWVLLVFAIWTLFTLGATVGTYRWGRILIRRANISEFGEYKLEGSGWYTRGMRAHANCVENLPVYGAIVFVMVVAGIDSTMLDVLSVILIVARVLQTSVHVLFEQKTVAVSFRSAFYNTQWACMLAMALIVASRAA